MRLAPNKFFITIMDKDIEEYPKKGISFFHGVDKLYKSSDARIKKKIVSSIFPKKLEFLKTRYRTAGFDPLIALILSKHKAFQRLEIKTPRQNGEESKKAPPLRLPETSSV